MNAILDSAQDTKEELRSASKEQKDECLKKAAESIDSNRETLKAANEKDMEAASTLNLQDSFIDRLKLDDKRIDSMISGLKKVIDLDLNSIFYCCKAVVPFMLKNIYGRIVNIASIAG